MPLGINKYLRDTRRLYTTHLGKYGRFLFTCVEGINDWMDMNAADTLKPDDRVHPSANWPSIPDHRHRHAQDVAHPADHVQKQAVEEGSCPAQHPAKVTPRGPLRHGIERPGQRARPAGWWASLRGMRIKNQP